MQKHLINSRMWSRNKSEFPLTATVLFVFLFLGCTVGMISSDGKLESQDLEVLQSNSSTSSDSSSLSYRFQCIVKGLSEDQLAKLTSDEKELDENIVINVYGVSNSSDEDGEEIEGRPYNIQFQAVNNTLVITGEIRSNKSGRSDEDNSLPINRCDVVFLDQIEARTGLGFDLVPESEVPPRIIGEYNHVVLINGAPDQILSCVAEGHPKPRMSWRGKGRNATPSLSKDNEDDTQSETRTSYLLFTHVTESTSGNYTCVAENNYGRATKTFEVEVISVETINLNCNQVHDSPSESSKVIYSQNIYDILTRSKRTLWYQWRGQKIYIPPFNRPLPPPTGGSGINSEHSDLQRLVNVITERLKLADKVAVNKWDNNIPVEDVPREQIILENMVRQAENRGLNTVWAQRFFRDQIEANKDIQYELIRIWRLNGRRPPGPPVDLGNDIRPRIDILNGKLIELAKRTDYERHDLKCRAEVEKCARYATFVYNLVPLHQKALQRATESVCIDRKHDPFPADLVDPYTPNILHF